MKTLLYLIYFIDLKWSLKSFPIREVARSPADLDLASSSSSSTQTINSCCCYHATIFESMQTRLNYSNNTSFLLLILCKICHSMKWHLKRQNFEAGKSGIFPEKNKHFCQFTPLFHSLYPLLARAAFANKILGGGGGAGGGPPTPPDVEMWRMYGIFFVLKIFFGIAVCLGTWTWERPPIWRDGAGCDASGARRLDSRSVY